MIEYWFNILSDSNDIDRDILYQFIDLIYTDEDILNKLDKEKLIYLMIRSINQFKNDTKIAKTYLYIIMKIQRFDNFVNYVNTYFNFICSSKELLDTVLDILSNETYYISKIKYNQLATFLLDLFHENKGTEKYLVFLGYLAQQNLLNKDQILHFKKILNLYTELALKYKVLYNIYLQNLLDNNDIVEAYSFMIKFIKANNYSIDKEILYQFLDIYNRTKEIQKKAIDYNVLLDITDNIKDVFLYDETFINFYIEVLEQNNDIKIISDILKKMIIESDFKSIYLIRIYVKFLTKYMPVLQELEIDFLQQLIKSYDFEENHDPYFAVLKSLMYYKQDNINKFYETAYNLIVKDKIINQQLIDLFSIMIINDQNIVNNIPITKAIHILDIGLQHMEDIRSIIISKSILLNKSEGSLSALNFLADMIKKNNYNVHIDIYEKFIYFLKLSINDINVKVVDIDNYLKIFDRLSEYIKKDISLMNTYLTFMYYAKLYEQIIKYAHDLVYSDINPDIMRIIIIFYIKSVWQVCNKILSSSDSLFSKKKAETIFVQLYEDVKTKVLSKISDSELVCEYTKVLELDKKYTDVEMILNKAINDKFSSNLFLVYKRMLEFLHNLKKPLDEQEKIGRAMMMLDPHKPDGYIETAKILYETQSPKKIEEADDFVRRAFSIDPHNPEIIIFYAKLLAKKTQFDVAINLLKEESKKQPNHPELAEALLDIYNQSESFLRNQKRSVENTGI